MAGIKCYKIRIKNSLWARVWDALGSKLSQLGQIDWGDWLVLLFAVLRDLRLERWIIEELKIHFGPSMV